MTQLRYSQLTSSVKSNQNEFDLDESVTEYDAKGLYNSHYQHRILHESCISMHLLTLLSLTSAAMAAVPAPHKGTRSAASVPISNR